MIDICEFPCRAEVGRSCVSEVALVVEIESGSRCDDDEAAEVLDDSEQPEECEEHEDTKPPDVGLPLNLLHLRENGVSLLDLVH